MDENNITSCPKNQCTGCAACFNSCPMIAIRMKEDQEGFLAPFVDYSKCNKCGLCRKVCPIITDISLLRTNPPKVYAAWSLDESIRTDSSSGGVFSVLSQYIFNLSGVVFGAAFDNDFKLRHYEAKHGAELNRLRGSKYLQSDIGDTYLQVKRYLGIGSKVMFVGTPCQVAGLYGYLSKEYANLLTCDLVCHGVPSQSFFDKYLNFLQDNGFTKFDDFSFRDKKNWGHSTILTDCSSENKDIIINGLCDYYQRAYLMSLVNRVSCYSCKFARIPRIGDLTLGDFWGIGKDIPFRHDLRQGVSLLLVNSILGKDVLQYCKNRLFVEERQLSEAKKMNPQLFKTSEYPSGRNSFLKDMETMSMEEIYKKYRLKKFISFKKFVKKAIYRAIGPGRTDLLKKYLNG